MISDIERPEGQNEVDAGPRWGSDVIAELLRRLELPFISLNPGASYRGLHDSLVNYLGNAGPQMVLCLHEEHAVAVAHGYAKVTGRPMAVALHSNVGLMHATMALFNAFCDRVPMLVLGATGPVDASERRPWIDWIHTAADQGALVRGYVKWDDQPGSAAAALESVLRGHLVTSSYPPAPVYICLDSALQEAPLPAPPTFPSLERHTVPAPPAPAPSDVPRILNLLMQAQRPLLLTGRVGRSSESWAARIDLAQRLGACVLTDLKVAAAFPTSHPLHPASPGTFLTASGRELVAAADVILSLDWVDLGGTLRQAGAEATVISCTADAALHNGWSKDHFELAPATIAVTAHPDLLVDALRDRLDPSEGVAPPPWWTPAEETRSTRMEASAPASATRMEASAPASATISMRQLAATLDQALAARPSCLVRLPLGWDGADLHAEHPLDYLGQDGGAGLGSGPGMAVGAALAFLGQDRLPVAVLGDGDLLMGAPALWTASHYKLPLLVVVANNRSFFNDEVHQERVARRRDRPVANRWIGQHIRDPEPHLARLAESLGLTGYGPVRDPAQLNAALAQAVAAASSGATVLVDVHIAPDGYPGGPPGGGAH